MRANVDACEGLFKHSLHWMLTVKDKALATPGIEPLTVLRLAFQSIIELAKSIIK